MKEDREGEWGDLNLGARRGTGECSGGAGGRTTRMEEERGRPRRGRGEGDGVVEMRDLMSGPGLALIGRPSRTSSITADTARFTCGD